jgi:hypothetical protein
VTWLEVLNAEVGKELDRYVLDHPGFAAEIPSGAQVVLQLADNPKFNASVRRLAAAPLRQASCFRDRSSG